MTQRKINRDMISPGQLFAILIGSMVGTGILGIARTVSEVSRQDAWLSVLAAGFGVAVNMIILYILAKRFPSKNIVEYSQIVLGKWLGRLIVIVYILYHIIISGLVLRLMDSLISTWFLEETPIWILVITSLLVIVYLTRNGITVLGRFNFFMLVLILPFFLMIFPPVLRRPLFVNLLPIGGTGIVTILNGIVPAVYSFLGYEVILLLYPYTVKKDKILRVVLGATLLTTFIYAVTVLVQLVVYDHSELQFMLYPLMRYISYIEVPLIERMEFVFIYFWVFSILTTIGVNYYAATLEIGTLLKLKDRKNVSFYIAPLVYFVAMYPSDVAHIIEIVGFFSKLGLIAALVMPVLILIVSIIRGLKEEKKDEKSRG